MRLTVTGAAMAVCATKEGAQLALVARQGESLTELAKEISGATAVHPTTASESVRPPPYALGGIDVAVVEVEPVWIQ